MALVLGAAIFARLVTPYSPLTASFGHALALPSSDHLLGTDEIGRDVLSRLIFGARPVLIGVCEAIGVAVVIGIPTGLVVGYIGGATDSIVGRIMDLVMSIPQIIVLLMALAVFTNSMTAAMVAFGILASPGIARLARSATIAVRNELYVAAARVSGMSASQIIRRHVAPAVAGPLIVNISLLSAIAVLLQAGLNYLGLGVQARARAGVAW